MILSFAAGLWIFASAAHAQRLIAPPGERRVSPWAVDAWKVRMNDFFSSPNPSPAALAGVLSSIGKLDLDDPRVRASLKPVIEEARLHAQNFIAAAPALDLLARARKQAALEELSPLLTETQARFVARLGRKSAERDRRYRRLQEKIARMSEALGRTPEQEPLVVQASDPYIVEE